MGYSGLKSEEKLDSVESISYTKYFEKQCPNFMFYGMSYHDFWYGDVFEAQYYLQAYKIKLKEKDAELWEQGMYIYEAILQCSPILRPFSKEKNPLPYTEKPHLSESNDMKKDEPGNEQEVENERLKAQIWINNWARSMKKQFENK